MVSKRLGTWRRILGIQVLGVGLVGCSDGSARFQHAPVELKEKSGIAGGEPVAPGSDVSLHTVLLIRQGSSGGGYNISVCTGTLLAPKIVLTAAHCVKKSGQDAFYLIQEPPADLSLVSVDFGSLAYSTPRKIILHSLAGRSDDFEQIDLAMIETFEAAPKFRPLRIGEVKSESHLLAAGFSFISSRSAPTVHHGVNLLQASLPLLQKAEAERLASLIAASSRDVQDSEREEYKEFLFSKYEPSESSLHLLTDQMDGRRGMCFGDSGGPLFVPSKEGSVRQVGVMVKSVQISDSGDPCGDAGFSVRLSEQKEWIDEVFNFLNRTENQSLFEATEPEPL